MNMRTILKISGILMIIGFAIACASQKGQQKQEEGFVSLFDGKTTTEWRGYNQEAFPVKGWVVEDGTLHVLGSGKGEAGGGGDIITKKKYRNFELSLEWKVSEGANSGIFYLAQEKPDQPIWKSAPEMQILDNEKHPDAKLGVDGNRMAGSLYDLIPGKPKAVKPAGEWNKAKMKIDKGQGTFWLNGKQMVTFPTKGPEWDALVANSKFKTWEGFAKFPKGKIALQDHGNKVWFRNIRIREL